MDRGLTSMHLVVGISLPPTAPGGLVISGEGQPSRPRPMARCCAIGWMAKIGILAGILEQGIASGQLQSLAVALQTLAFLGGG